MKRKHMVRGLAIGVAIGSGLGIALNNIALGIGVGVSIGVAIGLGNSRRSEDVNDETGANPEDDTISSSRRPSEGDHE